MGVGQNFFANTTVPFNHLDSVFALSEFHFKLWLVKGDYWLPFVQFSKLVRILYSFLLKLWIDEKVAHSSSLWIQNVSLVEAVVVLLFLLGIDGRLAKFSLLLSFVSGLLHTLETILVEFVTSMPSIVLIESDRSHSRNWILLFDFATEHKVMENLSLLDVSYVKIPDSQVFIRATLCTLITDLPGKWKCTLEVVDGYLVVRNIPVAGTKLLSHPHLLFYETPDATVVTHCLVRFDSLV